MQAQRKQRRQRVVGTPCFLGVHTMPWEDDGALNTYVMSKMVATLPFGLVSKVERIGRRTSLRFRFDGHYYTYHGYFTGEDSLQSTDPAKKRQWMGLDLFAESIARDLILDVATFDEDDFLNAEQVTCLAGPLNIRFTILLNDTLQLDAPVPGAPEYVDDFKFLHPKSDTLQIPVELDGEDTLVTIISGQTLNECQLAALKGIGVQLLFRQELDKYCGPPIPNLELIDPEKRGIFPIGWHPITISTGNRTEYSPYAIELSLCFESIIDLSEVMARSKDQR
ncbi:MAG: hypothetical protein U0176_17725 [Bacteroidia bacterium]